MSNEIRFQHIEGQIKNLCTACQNKENCLTAPKCAGYPIQVCAAIFALSQLTSGEQYVNASHKEICATNRLLLTDSIDADFG